MIGIAEERHSTCGRNKSLEGLSTTAELAFNMQREMREVMSLWTESLATLEMYGLGDGKLIDLKQRGLLEDTLVL